MTMVDSKDETKYEKHDGLFLRLKYKTKQKLRRLPSDVSVLQMLAKDLGAANENVIFAHSTTGDQVETQEDWEILVEALAPDMNSKFLDIDVFDENENDFEEEEEEDYYNNPPQSYSVPAQNADRKRKNEFPELNPRKRLKEEKRKSEEKKFTQVREAKTRPITEENYSEHAPFVGGLWYCQICLVCLTTVQYGNLKSHLYGHKHKSAFTKCPIAPTFQRVPPIIITEQVAMQNEAWIKEQQKNDYPVVFLCSKGRFEELMCYREGYRVLVLGEQDFSYSLAVANAECEVVGSSYMEAYDPNIPDPNPSQLDDGDREVYVQKTLSSMNGDLERNLKICEEKNVIVRHGVDATQLKKTLYSQGIEGDFDVIAFPFPRASLFRGCDPANSLLVKDFFKNIIEDKVLRPGGLVQLVMLEGQFQDWDVFQVSRDAGFNLEYAVYVDFTKFQPYRPRDLLGKAFSPKDVLLIIFKWNGHVSKGTEPEGKPEEGQAEQKKEVQQQDSGTSTEEETKKEVENERKPNNSN